MKKYALMLAMALPVAAAFTSCGDDEETALTITPDQLTLNYQASQKVKASESKGAWGSDNSFVASVDDKGEVKANYVGQTHITYTKEGKTATCQVTVNPTDNAYTLPILTWGASTTSVQNAVPSTLVLDNASSDANTLFYVSGNNDEMPWYVYLFKAGKLDSSSFTVTLDEIDAVLNWMDQYGNNSASDDDNFVYTYINANALANATMVMRVAADLDNDLTTVTFVPNDGTRASISDFESAFARHRAVIAKKAAK